MGQFCGGGSRSSAQVITALASSHHSSQVRDGPLRSPAGGELLFNVIASRYERRSVLVTTNLAFSEWPKVFGGDEKLTTALLDRLAHHAVVITTKGKSFRMRKRTEPAEDASTKAAKSGKNR